MTGKTNTILIVDDEVINLRMLERVLCNQHNVLSAASGAAALEIIKQQDVSLLITDQRMPGMTGNELLRRSRDINPNLVCMLVTAKTDNETSVEALSTAGAMRVIHKPWKREMVLQFVQDALAQRETLIECKQANAEIERALHQIKMATRELSLFRGQPR